MPERIPAAALIVVCGAACVAAATALALSEAMLGSPGFFAAAAVAWAAFAVVLLRVWRNPPRSSLLPLVFVFAVAMRVPLALAVVGPDSDMMRYLWDGRVQKLGYNPYRVVPADPALAHTHTADTAEMPSRRHRTPYPPAAQLFFRLVVTVHDSPLAMKLALLGCDLITTLVVWRFLGVTGRNEWLVIAYAWNPLVVLEVALSGHIDALGALWIAAAAYWLARKRTALASAAFVLSVGAKLLPIVLVPLFAGRIRVRDAVLGGLLGAALYLPFWQGETLPLGAVPNVVEYLRFNGPLYRGIAVAASPQVAAAIAVLLGLAVATWARRRLPATDPAAWAWPMAAALFAAPVVYPWYLLYLTPFLLTRATLPILAWTATVLGVYIVWWVPSLREIWRVPVWLLVLEYAVPLATWRLLARTGTAKSPIEAEVRIER